MTLLAPKQEELCATWRWDFPELGAVYINCTLKRSPEVSNTQGLADRSIAIMERSGVAVEQFRAVDHAIATGVYPDMTEHGWERDDRPAILERVIAADILVLLAPIRPGEKSSVCTEVTERLYGKSHLLDEQGQYASRPRRRVSGDRYTIPPQADTGWIGEAGPGPSYLDEGSGGPDNDFTNRNTTFMTWNLLHAARMLEDRGPGHGNQRSEWDAGCRFDYLSQPRAPMTAAAPARRDDPAFPGKRMLGVATASPRRTSRSGYGRRCT
ncbi:MAG TPA: flavodoxin family protein [Solirubrobacteraceae bacterium]|nr:flavodoxin family protein [Solirubrobacteraceae bacterium]